MSLRNQIQEKLNQALKAKDKKHISYIKISRISHKRCRDRWKVKRPKGNDRCWYHSYSEKNDQIKCFEEHINAAQELQIPIIVHTRSAEKETLEIIKKKKTEKDFKVLIHCFTGSKDFAFKLLDLGAYISASGVVTFKKIWRF